MFSLWLRTWQLGIKSLLLHPLRSLLTVLGIFIGVASVIWLLAIGEGISRKAQEQIEGLGATNIIVRSIKPPAEATENTSNSHSIVPYGITRADFERLAKTIPTIDRVLPIRELRYRFGYLGRMIEGRLVGCTPEYAEVNNSRSTAAASSPMSSCARSGTIVCWRRAPPSGCFPSRTPSVAQSGLKKGFTSSWG